MIARAHRAPCIAVMAMALLAVGCGAGTSLVSSSHTATRAARRLAVPAPAVPAPAVPAPAVPAPAVPAPAVPAPAVPAPGHQNLPAPGPSGVPAAATEVNVIRAWSDALRHGDVHGAAAYFALPSVMVNGSDASGGAVVIAIQTRAQAAAANATLPCGARLVSAEQRGRFVNALFRLTGRPGPGGTSCAGGVGATARTNFVIAHGRIVEWLRAPDDPGDNRTPQAPKSAPEPTPALPPSGPTV